MNTVNKPVLDGMDEWSGPTHMVRVDKNKGKIIEETKETL